MRKTAIALLALGSAALLVSPALAANIYLENFSYPVGNLVPNGGWAIHSGTTDIQVMSGGYIQGMTSRSADDNRAWSSPAPDSTSRVYACFKVRIPALTGTTPTVNGYFAHFKDTGTSNFRAKVFIIPSSPAFTFGISVSSNTATVWPTTLAYDTWYVVATCYDPHTRQATLWVDPVSEASPSLTVTEVATPNIFSSAYAFRQASVTGGVWTWEVDDLGVGTTFLDACETPVPVQQSTWGRIKSTYN